MKDLSELNASPTPWEYDFDRHNSDIICHLPSGIEYQVASVYIHSDEETDANANLIKEAPNLYKCLREAYLNMIGKRDFDGTESVRWKAVLEAASGVKPEEERQANG